MIVECPLTDTLHPQQDNLALFCGGCIGHRASGAGEYPIEVF